MTQSKYNTSWSREELILALYLYCQIPFAKTKASNPEVIRLAQLLGRTPSSVARKLGNFGAFDPLLSQRGISGLTHFSKADREIWNEFYQRWDSLVAESQQILTDKHAEEVLSNQDEAPVISRPLGKTEREATVLIRLGQAFFRRTVLSSYEYSCCVCEIDLPQLLVGSHILPWSANKEQRTDPQNGVCLCALHDRAFDRGLISINQSFEIMVSSKVAASRKEFTKAVLLSFCNQKIKMPRRFAPNPEYLDWHVKNIFQN